MSISARKFVIHIVLPLFAGLIIYIVFRKNTWLHQHIFPIDFSLNNPFKGWLADLIAFNLPDFCWSYSLTSALFIWERKANMHIPYFPAYILLCLLAAEAVQSLLASRFTFDWFDMIAAIFAFLLSYFANRKNEKI